MAAIPAPTTVANANLGFLRNTAGSLLILSPSDFGLPDFLCPGVAGQFNLQFMVSCTSNYQQTYIAGSAYPNYTITPEVNIMVQESGLFITESGQSSVEIAILQKDSVLDAKSSTEHIPADDYNEEVGGSIHNRNRGAMKGMPTKRHEHHVRHSEVGGSMSAGSMSAGAHHKHRLKKYIV